MTQRQIAWARSRRQADRLLDKEERATARATAKAMAQREIERHKQAGARTWVPTPSENKR